MHIICAYSLLHQSILFILFNIFSPRQYGQLINLTCKTLQLLVVFPFPNVHHIIHWARNVTNLPKSNLTKCHTQTVCCTLFLFHYQPIMKMSITSQIFQVSELEKPKPNFWIFSDAHNNFKAGCTIWAFNSLALYHGIWFSWKNGIKMNSEWYLFKHCWRTYLPQTIPPLLHVTGFILHPLPVQTKHETCNLFPLIKAVLQVPDVYFFPGGQL